MLQPCSGTPLRIGMLGLGTVARGVIQILKDSSALLAQRVGRPLVLHAVASRRADRQASLLDGLPRPALVCTDLLAVATHPEVDVLVELIGGVNDARSAVLAALRAGKHIITANKHLLAEHGAEIFAAARASGVAVGYEASCAGAIPVIHALLTGLQANRIDRIAGILNGTCNYILTGMARRAQSFESVLADAQQRGYAEAEPSLDIDGHDTAHKIIVLASLAFAANLRLDDLPVRGIRHVIQTDLRFAAELGYVIKLLATARRTRPDQHAPLSLAVEPSFLPREHPLAGVDGSLNAVQIGGSAAGDIFFSGRGAGSAPTASAVMADLLDCAIGTAGLRFARLAVFNDQTARPALLPDEHREARFYLRVMAADRPGVMASMTAALAREQISLAALIQHESPDGQEPVPIACLTHITSRGSLQRAAEQIARLNVIHGEPMIMPIID